MRALAIFCVPALAAAGCGGSVQDANAPRGNFPVAVTLAQFPVAQQLARSADMVIVVRNVGNRTVPNINVTTKCQSGLASSFEATSQDPNVADPRRPRFIVNSIPLQNTPSTRRPQLDPSPAERTSALADTYPLGQLAPGQSVKFDWNVTAVMVGDYRVCYHVSADLYGDAHAVASAGSLPLAGAFTGSISSVAPRGCIGPDNQTVTASCR